VFNRPLPQAVLTWLKQLSRALRIFTVNLLILKETFSKI